MSWCWSHVKRTGTARHPLQKARNRVSGSRSNSQHFRNCLASSRAVQCYSTRPPALPETIRQRLSLSLSNSILLSIFNLNHICLGEKSASDEHGVGRHLHG